jgi:general secretion pathway protein N
MLSLSRYVIIGVITLLLGLLIVFPARVANHWFTPAGVAISGIQGSIWRGHALEGEIGGIYVRNLNWQMRPWALFTGELAYSVEADAVSGFINGNVALGIGGSAAIRDLTASLSLQSMQSIVGMAGLGGTANLQFARLVFKDGIPVAADGTLEIANLVAPLIDRSSVGGFRAEFFTQESGIIASVEDTDAVVELAGSLSVSPDRTYQFIAQVAPKDTTPANLREQMRFLGTPNERGQYEMRLEGQL